MFLEAVWLHWEVRWDHEETATTTLPHSLEIFHGKWNPSDCKSWKCCLLEKRDHKLVFGQDTAAKIVMVWGSVISHIGKHVDRMRLLCTCETCDPSLLHLICPLPCHFKYRYRHLLGQNPSNLHHSKICPNAVF